MANQGKINRRIVEQASRLTRDMVHNGYYAPWQGWLPDADSSDEAKSEGFIFDSRLGYYAIVIPLALEPKLKPLRSITFPLSMTESDPAFQKLAAKIYPPPCKPGHAVVQLQEAIKLLSLSLRYVRVWFPIGMQFNPKQYVDDLLIMMVEDSQKQILGHPVSRDGSQIKPTVPNGTPLYSASGIASVTPGPDGQVTGQMGTFQGLGAKAHRDYLLAKVQEAKSSGSALGVSGGEPRPGSIYVGGGALALEVNWASVRAVRAGASPNTGAEATYGDTLSTEFLGSDIPDISTPGAEAT